MAAMSRRSERGRLRPTKQAVTRVHRVSQGGQRGARVGRADRRFNQTRRPACVDAEFTVPDDLRPDTVSACSHAGTSRVDPLRQRDVLVRPRARHPRHVDQACSASGHQPDAGVARSGLRAEQPPGDDGGRPRGSSWSCCKANEAGGSPRDLFPHAPKALRIAGRRETNPTCHLDIPYWSATPYLFGHGKAVKCIVATSARRSELPSVLTDTYLKDAMRDAV